MPGSMQLFLAEDRPDERVLAVLGGALGIVVETLDLPNPRALGFVQESLHSDGFRKGLLVSWPDGVEVAASAREVARAIARELDVRVLLEGDSDDGWLLVQADGAVVRTPIVVLRDGVDVAPLR